MAQLLAHVGGDGHCAGDLIAEFGNIAAILAASPEALARRASQSEIKLIGTAGEIARLALRAGISKGPILSTSEQLANYCNLAIGHAAVETVHVLFLDMRNCLIRDETIATGTIDQAPFSPREIVRRGLELNAAGLILAHNHTSGDPAPSIADKEATRRLASAARPLGIHLIDHVIVSRGKWTSFTLEGWL